MDDLRQAADLFRPTHDNTGGVDGWVSLEVSPLLAHDTAGTIAAAKALHAQAGRPNLFIKIPDTAEGLPAIEEAIFAGVPVNVTLLFSREQYVAAADVRLECSRFHVASAVAPNQVCAGCRNLRLSLAAYTPNWNDAGAPYRLVGCLKCGSTIRGGGYPCESHFTTTSRPATCVADLASVSNSHAAAAREFARHGRS